MSSGRFSNARVPPMKPSTARGDWFLVNSSSDMRAGWPCRYCAVRAISMSDYRRRMVVRFFVALRSFRCGVGVVSLVSARRASSRLRCFALWFRSRFAVVLCVVSVFRTVRRALVFGEDPASASRCIRLRSVRRALVFGEDPAKVFAFRDSEPV